MDLYLIIAIAFFLSIIGFGISIIIQVSKKRKLSIDKKKYYQKLLKQVSINLSSKDKIIDYDKMYHKILLDLGYVGSFGNILKEGPIEINDINKVWELHKLRNKLVHEFDLLNESVLRKRASEYKKQLEKIIL